MPEFKNKEEYEKWKAEKAKLAEGKIKSEPQSKKTPASNASPCADGAQNENNNKTQKPKIEIKKSIAKSGLLILSSLFIGVVFMILAKSFNEAKRNYLDGAVNVYFSVKNNEWSSTAYVNEGKGLTYVRVKFPSEVNEEIIEGMLKRDFKEFFKMVGSRYGDDKIDFYGISDQEKNRLFLDTNYFVTAYYDKDGNKLWQYSNYIGRLLSFTAIFFLIIFPLIYLLFKFIIWAIRTLRERPAVEVR
jgi:hypothetical protein